MGPRPAHLNLTNPPPQHDDEDDDFKPPKLSAWRDLPSPRAGEIPPALSPLDALAFRMRNMEQEHFKRQQEANGRRISRIAPSLVTKEMRNRPDYFRSLSNESRMSDLDEAQEQQEQTSPVAERGKTPISSPEQERERPVSHYPLFDRTSILTEDDAKDVPAVPTPFFDAHETQNPHTSVPQDAHDAPRDYFGISLPRASSPEPVEPNVNVQAPSPNVPPSLTNSIDTVSSHPRTRTNDSQRSQRSLRSQASERGLAPPQSPRYPRSPRSFQSIRSVPPDSGEEDNASASGSQVMSSSRKFSGSSASRPQSPFSPWMHPVHRSPSMTSEYSMSGSQQIQRPTPASFNFSRPMSSAGSRPSMDTRPSFDSRASFEKRPSDLPHAPHRQASGSSNNSTQASFKPAMSRENSGDDIHPLAQSQVADMPTPSMHGQPMTYFPDRSATPNGENPTYTYAKYALPRGRPVDREEDAFRDSWIQSQFQWDNRHEDPSKGHERNQSDTPLMASPARSEKVRGRGLAPAASETRSRSADPRAADKMHRSSPSVKTTQTDSTDRTIKAIPLHKKSPSADLTPEEHLEIGIEAHDSGATNKSTYHLRLAAMAELPTAMLLYALACRHGWGMRPNQAEGVKWLRKAIDTSGLDVADAEDKLNGTAGAGKKLDPVERKKRKAQYALAIYELGISSMNGWGCTKDKALAVRCYEIAGSWGDADALAEAAFCYTQGIGVKKDLHKAASLYRRAADLGMSMAGNSWIYKDKYNETADNEKEKKRPDTAVSKDSSKEKEKSGEQKGRQRSRSIWGKKEKREKLPPPSTMPAATRMELA